MKFNKNIFGNKLLTKIMKTVKPNIENIKMENDNGYLKYTKVDGSIENIDLDLLTQQDIMKIITGHPGTINLNPSGLLGSSDFTTIGSYYTKDTSAGVGGFNIPSYAKTLYGDVPIPISKNKKYRATINIKGYDFNNEEDKETPKLSFYFGTVNYDGDSVNWDSKNKMYLGNMIYPQNITFRGTNGYDQTTAYKYIITREFKKADDYFYFRTADISKWYIRKNTTTTKVYGHYQSIKFHRPLANGDFSYVAKNGKEHTNLGYSADCIYDSLLDQDTSKDITDPLRYFLETGNVIEGQKEYKAHIKKEYYFNRWMWRGKYDSYPVGTIMLQSYGGGTFCYWLSGYPVALNEENNYIKSSWIDFSSQAGMNSYVKYRDGTAFVKVLMLLNYARYDNNNHWITYNNKVDNKIGLNYSDIRLEYKNI